MTDMFANLRAEMERNSKTYKEMAELLSLSYDRFSVKLSGKSQFTLAEMKSMADFFNCSIDYLVGRKKDRTILPFFSEICVSKQNNIAV